eukprot:UN02610
MSHPEKICLSPNYFCYFLHFEIIIFLYRGIFIKCLSLFSDFYQQLTSSLLSFYILPYGLFGYFFSPLFHYAFFFTNT